jgi:DNA-binding PadR family transcriptional regulator
MSPVFRHGGLRLYLLKLLDEAPRHGYDVIRLLQDRFLGVYSPSPGTIYPRLARLEAEGLVTHETVDGKKVYRITEAGQAELNRRPEDLAELEDELAASVRDIANEISRDVRETVRNLRDELTWAVREAGRAGRAGAGPDQASGDATGGTDSADAAARKDPAGAGESRGTAGKTDARDAANSPDSATKPAQADRADPTGQSDTTDRAGADRRRVDLGAYGTDSTDGTDGTAQTGVGADAGPAAADAGSAGAGAGSAGAGAGTAGAGARSAGTDASADGDGDGGQRTSQGGRGAGREAGAESGGHKDKSGRGDWRDFTEWAERGNWREFADWAKRQGWADWASKQEWQDWKERTKSGHSEWAQVTRPDWLKGGARNRRDAGPDLMADLENVAAAFAREVRGAARQAENLSEDAMSNLGRILSDTLSLIRNEVFRAGDESRAKPATPPSPPADKTPADKTPADDSSTGAGSQETEDPRDIP